MMRSCLSYLLLSLSYVLSPAAASCADTSTPTTFSVKGVAYVKYETYPGSYDTPPNSTQLAFEVVNAANGVSTGCSLQNAEFQGQWPDDSTVWRSCIDRTLSVDGQDYPVKTSALFLWEEWKLTVNQTWDCGDETAVRHISTATLEPDCEENKTAFQYVNSCSAPDLEVAATLQ